MTPSRVPARRRCRPLRVERDDVLWFVTCRTIEERFWLHPLIACGLEPPSRRARRGLRRFEARADRRIDRMVRAANARKGPLQPTMDAATVKRIARGLVGSALARAQKRYGVEVYALVVMSNHVHLVVRTPRKNLARFMGYFKARVAGAVNRITGKRGPLWARRYDAQPILDDEAAAGRVAYTVRNPCSAGLVDRPEQWPGLNLAFGLGDSDALPFEHLNCTAWHRAGRPKSLERHFETSVLELSPLPKYAGSSRETYREGVLGWMQESATSHAPAALGVDAVVDTAFDARPKRSSFSRRPYAFGTREARAEEHRVRCAIHASYARASKRMLGGDRNVVFPQGTYPPPILAAA